MADLKETDENPGSPWPGGTWYSMKTKEAVLCLCTPRDSVHLSLLLLSSQPSGIVKWKRVGQHVQIHPLSQQFPILLLKAEFTPN